MKMKGDLKLTKEKKKIYKVERRKRVRKGRKKGKAIGLAPLAKSQ